MENSTTQRPSTEDIARQAYFLYQQRGCKPGHELDDWLAAEALLSAAAPEYSGAPSNNGNPTIWSQPVKSPGTRATKRSKTF